MLLKIDLNEPRIREKVTSDRFGLLVSHEWKRLIDPYTPRDTGVLMGITGQTVDLQPFGIWYKSNYAETVYYNPRGVTYITNGTGRNPYATQEWDVAAEKAGQLDKLYRILNNALESGRF
jgi:hypothetical protein